MMKYKLKDVCIIRSGGTPSRSNSDFYNSSFIPWVKVGDLDQEDIILSTEEYISEEGLLSIGNRVFEKGTLLLAMYGSVGKTAIAGTRLTCNQAVLGIDVIDKNNFDNEYLKYWFDFHKAELIFRSKGGILKNLNKGYVELLEVDFPNIEQQRQIVYRLNSLKKLMKNRKSSFDMLDEYVFSIFIKIFGNPINNSKAWNIKPLKDLGDWKSGGTPPRKNDKYFLKGTVQWFTSGELNGYYLEKSKEQISKTAIKETSAKLVKAGSLMIGMYDTAALKTSIPLLDCSCNQAIAFAELNGEVDPLIVQIILKIGKEYYLNKRKGVRQKNLNLTFIKSIEIICPPPDLQEKYKKIFKQIEKQKNNIIKSLDLLSDLRKNFIYRIFTQNDERKYDEIDILINDDIQLELFLNTINSSDYETEEYYDVDIKKLYKILDRTRALNQQDGKNLKGLVQRLEGHTIIIETNKEYKYRLSDEAAKN
ncbi:restriction endonuclease subunit S [Elizabethkingia ursingii]|uniref:restriction endonuclease subunit S n=1 Tax=Elizabethkingia ursingii TaxID=1756150 RepID=UPI002011973B|nr:restriction endonuclease subunit S [Elizabethkingia ursingii]MCL1665127.1 restriction endonuclease subunit S [Elizabethkingia ursingii]